MKKLIIKNYRILNKILITLSFLSVFTLSNAQTATYDDFNSLIPDLQTENWNAVFKNSTKILKNTKGDKSSDFRPIILYMNILSGAGMVSKGEMSYKSLKKKVMKFQGQRIIMAAHLITTKQGTFGKTSLTVNDTTNEAFTTASNARGTSILCFEKFLIEDKINVDKFRNRIARCGGTLDKIEFNPNQSTIWILRLTVNKAFIRTAD